MVGDVGLIGREHELSTLRSLLEREHHAPVIVEVRGEAGIGKTVLLNEFARLARSAGICTLAVSGARSEMDLAFATLTDLLDPVFSRQNSERVLETEALGTLSTIWPSLRIAAPDSEPTIHEICRAMTAAIEAVELPGVGILMIVDDFHWADDSSATVISYLARHVRRSDLMIAFGTRPIPGPPSRSSAFDVTRAANSVIQLGPMSAAESLRLIENVSEQLQPTVLHLAGGNPFYLTRLAQHLGGNTSETLSADAVASIPAAVADSILADIQALTEPARALVESASVLGETFDLATAQLLAGLEPDVAAQAVSELGRTGLILPVPDSVMLSFRHPLATKVIYDSLGFGQQRVLHRAAAQLLADSGVDPIQAVSHVERSADIGDLQAVEKIVDVAQSVAGLSPHTAARLYRSAIQLLPPGEKYVSTRTHLLMLRVSCLLVAGKSEQARVEIAQMQVETKGDPLVAAALIGVGSRVGIHIGDADFNLIRSGPELTDLSDPLAVASGVTMGLIQIFAATVANNLEQVRTLGSQMVELAIATQDVGQARLVACVCAYAESRIGDPGLAASYADIAEALVDEADDADLRLDIEVFVAVIHTEQWIGRWQTSLDHAQHAQRLVDPENRKMQFVLQMVKHGAYLSLNDIPAAESANASAKSIAQEIGSHALLAVCTAAASELRMLAGDSEKADELAAAAVAHLRLCGDTASQGADPMVSAITSVLVGQTWLRQSQPQRCRELILEFCGGPSLPFLVKALRARAFELLTMSEIESDRPEGALIWAESARDVAAEFDHPFQVTFALRAATAARLANGDLDVAQHVAEQSADQAEKAGVRVEVGLCHITKGRVLLAQGDEEAAVACFRDAVEIFDSVGAGGYASVALRELRALGRGSTRRLFGRTASGVESLSPRQAQIATLISEGMTNQEIADRLFLSRRTVDGHVVRILRQLGVKSRNAAAGMIRAVEEADSGVQGDA